MTASPHPALRRYLTTPRCDPTQDYRTCRFVALDLETTGLSARRDSILGIGFVPLTARGIPLAEAERLIVRPAGALMRGGTAVGASATIHGLTDDVVAAGQPLEAALDRLLTVLAGRVVVAHHARLERRFLRVAARRLWRMKLPLMTVDTARLQRRLLERHLGAAPEGALTLVAARAHFGLPRYRSHDPLTDALACAELFLAQTAELAADAPLPLARLLG